MEICWAEAINEQIDLPKGCPLYRESDHSLNTTSNHLATGPLVGPFELLRKEAGYLDAISPSRSPYPMTARSPLCRRFDSDQINAPIAASNDTRAKVWKQQPGSFFKKAVIDAVGTMIKTTGECKESVDVIFTGEGACNALVLSLANTCEPLDIDDLATDPATSEQRYFDKQTRGNSNISGEQ